MGSALLCILKSRLLVYWWVLWYERKRKLCPVRFIVVGECQPVICSL